jgi:NAD(P)H-dependent flavin oxidoreductase YrpB (nitropropane dioxygenase family)
MIRTGVCDVLDVEYPILLGGMPLLYNTTALTANVSEAGGLGIVGCTYLEPAEIAAAAEAVREQTNKPFGFNILLFLDDEAGFEAALAAGPEVMSFSWPRKDQDLEPWIGAAHDAGCKVTFMASDVGDALRGADAGADVIVAQGTEGGGHVGWMALSVLLPLVVDAVGQIPVIAAGGVADGRGLVAALAYGADGVLLGTRFLATQESGLHPDHKRAIVDSDGHDTVLSDIPDILSGMMWPGAMSRVRRNRLLDRWAGREWALRENISQARADAAAARESGDPQNAPLFYGQDAGLINDIPPAAEIVTRIITEAEQIIAERLSGNPGAQSPTPPPFLDGAA